MAETIRKPSYIKYRREADFGLVYDHQNYGYEDASLLEVNEVVVDVLERVDGDDKSRDYLEATFSSEIIDALIERGLLINGDK